MGADVHELPTSWSAPLDERIARCRRGQRLFGRLAQGPLVTVAAIDGACLGGGAELAAWCDGRVVSDSPHTELGFPEVTLGMIPGWGGTVRACRLVGLANAVQMITGGKPLDARRAVDMGWASDRVPARQLQQAAVDLIRALHRGGQYLRDRLRLSGPVAVSPSELAVVRDTASHNISAADQGAESSPADGAGSHTRRRSG